MRVGGGVRGLGPVLAADWLRGVVTGCRLLRFPGELPAMVVALATGVGLTVAAYALFHAVLITPLPYRDPGRLVQVWEADSEPLSGRVLRDRDIDVLAAEPSPFQGIAGHAVLHRDLVTGPGMPPVRLVGAHVSVGLFEVLGVGAARGRTFRPEDSQLTDISPIIVSERLVRSGVVSGRLGDTVEFEGWTHRLIGTMPEAFWFPDRETSFWAPVLVVPPELLLPRGRRGTGTSVNLSRAIARLLPEVSVAAAQAQVNVRLALPGDRPGRVRHRVESHASLLTAPVRPALMVLQSGSWLVLLLVSLSVGWLFAARGRRLRQTFATLRALGATTGQVLVTHLASAACMVAVAAPCAVLIAWGLLQFSLTLENGVFSRTTAPAITGHVMTVAFVATVLTGMASCLPGAVAVARRRGSLDDRTQAATRGRWDHGLMVVQAGLVFALGAQSVLVAVVLQSLVRTNVGFTKTDFIVARVEPRGSATIDANVQITRYKALLDQLQRQGISAAAASNFPLSGSEHGSTFEPRLSPAQDRAIARLRAVTPSYFRLTGLTAKRGRLLTEGDAGAHLMVVNDAFLASVLPSETELGRRVGQEYEWTVVGVTRPVRQHSVHEEIRAEAHVLFDDLGSTDASLAMRWISVLAETSRGVPATIQIIRTAVADQMPEFTIRSATPVMDLIRGRMGRERLVAAGAVVFAAISLLLAALGLYARVSQGLALRGREIGIRMALGATVRRIALESARPVGLVYAAGVGVGTALLLLTLSATRAVMVPPPGGAYPPLWALVATSAAVLLAAFAAACWRPIRAATRVEPADSLRAE